MPLKWLGLAAAAALLASGCTAQPQNANRVNQSNLFTTTGDADTCAAALGNTVGANAFWGMAGVNRNVTANGVIIGNVALVALPRESQNTPVNGAATGTGGQNGAAAGTGVQTGATGGSGVPMGAAGDGVGTGTAADPLERVRTACPTLADIRVVNDETDRARLAEITAAVRSGRPVTEFMSELATMAQRATSAGPGASGRQRNRPENFRNRLQQGNLVPGRAGTPTTPAPAAPRTPPAPNAPGTDGRGSTPARPGTGTATDPGTSATD